MTIAVTLLELEVVVVASGVVVVVVVGGWLAAMSFSTASTGALDVPYAAPPLTACVRTTCRRYL